MSKVILLLGSNLGDPKKNIVNCKKHIINSISPILAETKLIKNPPIGFESDSMFYNQAIEIETLLSPIALLHALENIEKQMGRTQKSTNKQYHDRIIDIDIIYYNTIVYKSATLSIPHKANTTERTALKQLICNIF